MKSIKPSTLSRLALLTAVGTTAVALAWPVGGTAQDKPGAPVQPKHAGKSGDADKDLAAQLRELQEKITKLEAALTQGLKGSSDTSMGGMQMDARKMGHGMSGMMGMGGMGAGNKGMSGMEAMGRDEMMQMMAGMQGKGMGGMSMEDDDMEMMGMMGMGNMSPGGMKGMGKMQQTAALPGFPGASHIYHIGATGFFLDHPEHITLSTEQQAKLNKAKQKALTEKATAQRKIDEAEQKLWELTGADEPDAGQIQAKVQEIEKLRGEQRLAFIRAVGEAAKALTDDQRKVLLGLGKPAMHKHDAPPAK